jgi:hypothetical protein
MAVSQFGGLHSGERAFLIGNGPSLEETPLHLLDDEICIAMNKIDMLYDETSWRPTYYLQINESPPEEMVESTRYHVSEGFQCFIAEDLRDQLPDGDAVTYLDRIYPDEGVYEAVTRGDYQQVWSEDLSEHVYLYKTSMYVAAQLASYMGFDELYFLGCDLYPVFKPVPYRLLSRGSDPNAFASGDNTAADYRRFVTKSEHPFSTAVNGVWYKLLYGTRFMSVLYRTLEALDRVPKTHFAEGYKAGKPYNEKLNNELVKIHRSITAIGEEEGFDCYNATVGGDLEVYDRVDVEAIAEKKQAS